MIIGVDFDNTLVCYNDVFYTEAIRQRVIPSSVPSSKLAVREYLRSLGRDDYFTMLQGYIYGPGITAAPAYSGAKECLHKLIETGITVYIISHKTRYPYLGPRYDLHQAARTWLKEKGFYAPNLFAEEHVFLEKSKEEKMARIADLGCTHFIDDLPEFLGHPDFPPHVKRLLFCPEGESGAMQSGEGPFIKCASWKAIHDFLLRDVVAPGAHRD